MTVRLVISLHTDPVSAHTEVMAKPAVLDRLRIDPFIVGIVAAAGLAALLPARGAAAGVASTGTVVAISLLFFLYVGPPPPAEAIAGLKHWRLHLTVVMATFVLFPLLVIAA